MEDSYYGFVYIWFDTNAKKYIIGSHHGNIDDGYTTSTGGKKVSDIFKARPLTMKRRILEYNTIEDNFKYTQLLEQRWLDLRPHIAKNNRYYNTNNISTGGISADVQYKQLEQGTHYFQSEAHSKRVSKQNIEKAKRGEHISQLLVKNGTHHFLGGKIQRESNNRRVNAGVHNFQQPAHRESVSKIAKKRCREGTHHFSKSEFNMIPFKLKCSDGREWEFKSKVSAVKFGIKPGVLDKVKRSGKFVFIRGSKGRVKFSKGDILDYTVLTETSE